MGITFITIKAVITALIITIPLLLLLVHRWRVGNIIIPTAGVVYAAALLPVAYLLSTIFASNKFSALLNINFNTDSLVIVTLGFLAMLATILIGINKTHFKNINIYKLIIYLISVVLTLFTVKILWQLTTSELPVWLSSINLVGSWVDISAMLALLISMLMGGKILKLGGRYSRVFMVIIVTLLTLCLVVFVNVISIIAILALVSAMQIISVIYKNREVASSKVLFIIPAIVLVISGVFTADNTMLNSKISTTLQNWTKISFFEVRPNWQGTLTVAKGTVVDSDITSKLFGPGVGSFEDQWRLYKPISVNSTQFWDTNFSYAIGFIPTSIITGGIIVFVAWAALFLMLLKLLIRNNKSNVAYPVLFIWLFMLFNPVDYILLIIAFILTGLLVVESINKNMTKSVKYRLRGEDMHKAITQILLPVIVITTLGISGVVLHRAVIHTYLVRASNLMLASNSNEAEILLSKAKNLADLAVIEQAYTNIAFSKLFSLVEGEAEELNTEEVQAALSNVLAHAKSAIEKDPGDPVNYIALARISEQLIGLKIEGARESAMVTYQQAAILDPLNPSIPFALARLSAADEDKTDYAAYLEQSIAIKPNYIPALYQYALLKLTENDKELASQILSAIVQLDNNHANSLYYLSEILFSEGRVSESLLLMKRVQLLNPDNEAVASLVTRLEDLIDNPTESLEKTE